MRIIIEIEDGGSGVRVVAPSATTMETGSAPASGAKVATNAGPAPAWGGTVAGDGSTLQPTAAADSGISAGAAPQT